MLAQPLQPVEEGVDQAALANARFSPDHHGPGRTTPPKGLNEVKQLLLLRLPADNLAFIEKRYLFPALA